MQAFIFDFDGVIVDSERHWRELGDTVFYPSIIPGWTHKDGARMMGLGFKAGHDMLVAEYGLQMPFEEYREKLGGLVTEIYMERLQLLPGLLPLIERIQKLELKIAIGSSGNRPWIESVLTRHNIREYFPIISSSEDVGDRTKPHPDIFLLAAKRLGIDPVECFVLEDSTNGIKAAKAAGMTCIAIKTDMSALQDLSQADKIVEHYDEITEEYLLNS